jgi:hypothetical protein
MLILHDIEASVIEADLHLYMQYELKEIPKKLKLANVPDWTDGEINGLVDKSGTLFIHAATRAPPVTWLAFFPPFWKSSNDSWVTDTQPWTSEMKLRVS